MKWLSLLLAGLLSIISIPAGAADLYLIKIENQTALDAANRIVGSARGMVGDRFLVDLSADQAGQLSGAGISIEKIESSYTGGKLFLISPVSSNYVVEPKGISYLYTRDHLYLAELGEKEIGTLRDEGFQIVPIGDRTTPFFYHPPLVPAPSMAFYPSDTLADMVSQDSLYSYVHRLELFKTRYAYSDSISAARDWLMSRFAEFGYSTISLDPFIYNGHSLQNVVCLKAGTTEPTRYIVIGAHYDSYCQNADPYITAPGADDNGSGTGAVLELARILKDVPFKYSIIFAPFSAEEEGLIGSAHMASEMKSQGTDIDFMLNFDMISFTAGDADSVLIFNYPDYFRSNCFRDAAGRVTDVVPMQYNGANGSSDEYSFYQQGYRTVGFMEWDFNMANYHRTTDLTTNMDFPYYQKVVKIIAAALGVINNALPPVNLSIYDLGDGHTLRVVIGNHIESYSYRLFYGPYSSTSTWRYTDTVDIPAGQSQYDIAGLTENTPCYVAGIAINSEGYHSIEMVESSLAPHTVPRPPYVVSCIPDSFSAVTTWNTNLELDINHYRILRRDSVSDWSILADNLTDTVYRDLAVDPHTYYSYIIQAVDNDLNISHFSNLNGATPATFDWPLLFLEETNLDGLVPSENGQRLYYDSIFAGIPNNKIQIDTTIDAPNLSDLGQYSSLFYFDDDHVYHFLSASLSQLDWYLGYETDMLLAGWKTIYSISGNSYFYPGDLFYDHFGLTRNMLNSTNNFLGANPESGWPSVEFKSLPPYYGLYPDITVFEKIPEAKVIYTYKSNIPGSYYDNKPVGIAFNTGNGQRVVLGFPIYYMTVPTAQALLAKVQEYFAQGPIYGDANHDDNINALDVTFLINYLYKHGPAPYIINNADPNGDCRLNALDITYLINFLYKGGPAPKPGCIN